MLSIAEKKLENIDVTKDNNFKSFIKRRALRNCFCNSTMELSLILLL